MNYALNDSSVLFISTSSHNSITLIVGFFLTVVTKKAISRHTFYDSYLKFSSFMMEYSSILLIKVIIYHLYERMILALQWQVGNN